MVTLPRRRFGAQWALELSTADPTAEPGSRPPRRPHRGHGHRALDRGPEAGRVSAPPLELRATYRLQLTRPTSASPTARALVPYLRDLGISHLYLSPSLQARPRLHPRLRRDRPARASRDELGGPEELRALSGERARRRHGRSSSTWCLTTWPPTTQNRYWADPELRAKFFDIEPATGVYRRFFDIGELAGVRQEDPAVFEETHELVIALVREGRDRRAPGRPPRRARRSRRVSGPAARARRRARVGREDPRSRRAAARLAGVRHGRLRVPRTTPARCSSIRLARPR